MMRALNEKSQEKGALVANCIGCKAQMLITLTSDGSAEYVPINDDEESDKNDVQEQVESDAVNDAANEEEAFAQYERGSKCFEDKAFIDAFAYWRSAYKWFSMNSTDLLLIAGMLNNMGMVKSRLGTPTEALCCYEQALELLSGEEEHKDGVYATVLNNIGGAYLHIGDLVKAEEFHRRAYELHLNNPSDPNLTKRERENLVFVYKKISALNFKNADYRNAINHEKLCVEIYERAGDIDNLKFHYLRIGNLFRRLGRSEKLSTNFELVLKTYQEALNYHQKADANPLICLEDLKLISEIYRNLGRIEGSIAAMQKIEVISSKLTPEEIIPSVSLFSGKESIGDRVSRLWSKLSRGKILES
jgi:tetratricopeptide (TPR) repeat protein